MCCLEQPRGWAGLDPEEGLKMKAISGGCGCHDGCCLKRSGQCWAGLGWARSWVGHVDRGGGAAMSPSCALFKLGLESSAWAGLGGACSWGGREVGGWRATAAAVARAPVQA